MATTPTVELQIKLDGVFALFEYAINHRLKWPKIRLQARDGQLVVLKRAGEKSRYPGQIMVTDDRPFGSNLYFGRIDRAGVMNRTAVATEAVIELLRRLSADAAGTAAEYGRLTGHCCFCWAPLCDERSTAEGYGPVCAKNFGLPWGHTAPTLKTAAEKAQEAAEQASAPYPWCIGNPTKQACIERGFCSRNPNCGE